MVIDPTDPGPDVLAFLTERHLATLTTLRADGSPHVGKDPRAPLPSQARAGTLHEGHGNRGARRSASGGRRWLTLEGTAVVHDDGDRVADAVARYAVRYRQPRENPARVAVEIAVDRILGSA
jgi:hypothetical protein